MSLPLQLVVRVGDSIITDQVQSLAFRKEAIGGVRSISFTLARSLASLGLDPLAKVYVYDGRTAATVAEGRLADTGRTASATGEQWDVVAFGPAQHASDISTPLIYVDRSMEGWRFYTSYLAGTGATSSQSQQPGTSIGTSGLLSAWTDGTPVVAGSVVAIRYAGIREAGLKLARMAYNYVHGISSVSWSTEPLISTAGSWVPGQYEVIGHGWTTTPSSTARVVGTDFANGRDVVDLCDRWYGSAATVVGDSLWGFYLPVVEAIRLNQSGAEVLSGYNGVVRAHQVVGDLLGRLLPEFDGVGAVVDTSSTYDIDQLAYPSSVTSEQVLADLMSLVPAYRWYTTPDATGDGYGFRWEPWPTTVRYEATLDDGGSFPISAQTVYNAVIVRWMDSSGRPRTSRVTVANAILDGAGVVRQADIDLAGEVGSEASAAAFGFAFLDEHSVPKNSGTLTVARPIRDLVTGRLVDPWEIEPGELVRVLGVEAYPDVFNANTNDGQGVFRIFASDYMATEDSAATLSLDADPRETSNALVLLLNQMNRSGSRR